MPHIHAKKLLEEVEKWGAEKEINWKKRQALKKKKMEEEEKRMLGEKERLEDEKRRMKEERRARGEEVDNDSKVDEHSRA